MLASLQKTMLPMARRSPLFFHPATVTLRPTSSLFFNPVRSFNAAATMVDIEADRAASAGPFAIKIATVKSVSNADLLEAELAKAKSVQAPVCFYPIAHPKPHTPSWSGTKTGMHYSKWKLNAAAEVIRGGKSLIEAKNLLAQVDKKGGRLLTELLDEVSERGIKRGYNPEQMFVKTITVGGSILFKKPDIKGRGRTGLIRKPVCSMRLCLEEKSPAEFFKLTIKGETPPGLSGIFRKMMYQNKGDFEHIKASSHMLTSNGRRYRRV